MLGLFVNYPLPNRKNLQPQIRTELSNKQKNPAQIFAAFLKKHHFGHFEE